MKKAFLVLSITLFLFSCGNEISFTAPEKVAAGSEVIIKYDNPVSSVEGDKCWISIVKEGSPEGDWGVWKYVDNNASSDVLIAPETAGKYEIRLYANYPKETHNLVVFQSLIIE